MAVEDLRPGDFPGLCWEPEKATESLQLLYVYVTNQAKESQDWYLGKRARKKRAGFALRLSAMFAATLAGIIPVLAEIYEEGGVPQLNPVWSSVAIAVAALLIAIDRLGGMTSGWVRYMLASQEISRLEEAFRIEWEVGKLAWKSEGPSREELLVGLERCRAFLRSVNEVVEKETRIWAAEFLKALREIDRAAEVAAEPKQLGVTKAKAKSGDFSSSSGAG